jgi:deazaflavin-dependent oxidoreductase (nitroreductase family)
MPGTSLYRLLNDHQFRRDFHARLKTWNPWVVVFYRIGLLPLLGVSRTVMILTTRGRKSGRLRRTPIGYFLIGGKVHVISAWGRSASWYQNLCADPSQVEIQIGLRRRKVRPEILESPEEILQTLEQFTAESPKAAEYLFGWDAQTDQMETSDFSAFGDKVQIVRFS